MLLTQQIHHYYLFHVSKAQLLTQKLTELCYFENLSSKLTRLTASRMKCHFDVIVSKSNVQS